MLHDLRPFEERRTGKGSAKRERIEGDLRGRGNEILSRSLSRRKRRERLLRKKQRMRERRSISKRNTSGKR